MPAQEPQAQVFSYQKPDVSRPKGIVRLGKTDQISGNVQVVAANGGETNLHSHGGIDSVYFVLNGRVRFYSDVETVLAELGPSEGVVIPHDCKYWFENAGVEPLEILHVTASIPNVDRMHRVNYTQPTSATAGTEFFDAGGPGQVPTADPTSTYDPGTVSTASR